MFAPPRKKKTRQKQAGHQIQKKKIWRTIDPLERIKIKLN